MRAQCHRLILALVGLMGVPVQAGNDHIEGLDAGSFRGSAQPAYKSPIRPQLQLIQGQLASPSPLRAGADREDMYRIRIVNPATFLATTEATACAISDFNCAQYCGHADFDPQLWLFKLDGDMDAKGLLANDDVSIVNVRSRLPGSATDGSGAIVVAPGEYLLAITAFDNDPTSDGDLIFDQVLSTEVSGPDGMGGASIHDGWTGDGPADPGAYTIVLRGVEGILNPDVIPPPECPSPMPAVHLLGLALMGAAVIGLGAGLLRRRSIRGS